MDKCPICNNIFHSVYCKHNHTEVREYKAHVKFQQKDDKRLRKMIVTVMQEELSRMLDEELKKRGLEK